MTSSPSEPGAASTEGPATDLAAFADRELLALLRHDLVAAGYTVDGVTAALGPVAAGALHREQRLPADRLTDGADSPALVLTRLFTLGRPVPRDLVDVALPSVGATGLVRLGLAHGGDELRADVDLRPYGDGEHDWWLVSDLGELALGHELPVDHVLGIGGASTTLASWTPRPHAARALDLGTGCGIQALHLSQHCDEVVATDISRRALGMAAFNAALDDVVWDLRPGSLLEPVAGERFDLVVSNPPFVITPRVEGVPLYEYRDGGRSGDRLVREVVQGLPDVLAPGGIACLLANWEIPRGSTWQQSVRSMIEGTGLDAWVVQREQQDPAEYAELWARDGGSAAGAAFERMYAAWLDDFASREVDRIGFGVVVLQRPLTERAPFVDLVDHRGPVDAPMGPHVLDGLRARTWLAEHTDAEVAAVAWRCADDVTEERFARPGAPDPSVIRVRQGGGLGVIRNVGTAMAAYLSVADGSLTPAQALPAIAQLLERDAAEVEAECLPVIRDLVADGLLV